MKGHVYGIVAVVLIALVLLTGLRTTAMFRLGIENIPQKFIKLLQKKSVGLISNQSGRDQRGCRSVDILLAHGIQVKKIFVPEYECSFAFFAVAEPTESLDELTGISTINLSSKDGMRVVHSQMLDGIDTILFDVQVSGMRYHSYLATMLHMMQVAQQHNKMFVIFDRPNPLGNVMEGPVVEHKKKSNIAVMPIPIRHGLTIGELAWYCNMHVLKHPTNLVVVKMANYDRSKDTCPIAFNVSSSANKYEACLGDNFLSLLKEIRPFHVTSNNCSSTIMLPENRGISRLGWLALAQKLERLSITSEYDQCYYDGLAHSGLNITVDNINHVSILQILTELFIFCNDHHVTVSFTDCFDSMLGTSLVRDRLEGRCSLQRLTQKIDVGLTQFCTTARASFMYMPLPQICNFVVNQ